MTEVLALSAVHVGAVRGRYFRENFAQGRIDLAQIIPELVTNADAAIAASGRDRGRIELRFGRSTPTPRTRPARTRDDSPAAPVR